MKTWFNIGFTYKVVASTTLMLLMVWNLVNLLMLLLVGGVVLTPSLIWVVVPAYMRKVVENHPKYPPTPPLIWEITQILAVFRQFLTHPPSPPYMDPPPPLYGPHPLHIWPKHTNYRTFYTFYHLPQPSLYGLTPCPLYVLTPVLIWLHMMILLHFPPQLSPSTGSLICATRSISIITTTPVYMQM